MKLNSSALIAVMALSLLTISCSSSSEGDTQESSTKAASTESHEKAASQGYYVDTEQSSVTWKGTMLGVYSHSGTVGVEKGKFSLTGDEPEMIYVSIDMTDIIPTDDNYSEENTKEMLVGHLQSEDFFLTEKYPTAVLKMAAGEEPMLTVRGAEGVINLQDVEVKREGENVVVVGNFSFDRQKFGVTYKGASEAVLADDIEVGFEIHGKKS